MLDIGLSSVK